MMTIAENAVPYPTTCSDDDNIYYEHKVFSNSVNMDISNLQETEDGCFVTIHRNHLNQFIEIRNSAGDGIGWVLINTLTTTDPLELSGTSDIPDDLPQPVIEAVLPDQQANEAVLPDENAIAAVPQAAIEEALSGQSENEAVLPDQQGGVLPDMDDIVLQQDNAGLGLDQPDKVVPQHAEELQNPTGNAEVLQDPTGNVEGLQDPPANPLQVQITGFTFRFTDVSNSEEKFSENPTSEQV